MSGTPLSEAIQTLLAETAEAAAPQNRALRISVFASKALREGWITLYEAYQLKGTAMELEWTACTQAAWPSRVQISTLLELLNLRLMARVCQEPAAEAHWLQYGREALGLNREKRPHYIADRYLEYLDLAPERLLELKQVRHSRSHPFNKGPYHMECFPFEAVSCEELVLEGRMIPAEERTVRPEIGDLLAELYLLMEV